MTDLPALILWLCPGCQSTKAIYWEEASERLRRISYDASRDAVAAWRRLRRSMEGTQ